MLKVLFQSRTNLYSVPGGDTTQILQTAKALRNKGCTVDISTELDPDVSSYDLVHLFNLMRPQEIYLQSKNAVHYKKPVVLSTIYGLYTEFEKYARGGILGSVAKTLTAYQIEYLKVLARFILNGEINKGTMTFLRRGYLSLQKKTCNMISVYLPNSHSEMVRVIQNLNLQAPAYVTVPNAVDIGMFDHDSVEVSNDIACYKDCILCVGRIEGRKSQLNLIRAVNDLPYSLVIIGKPGPNSHRYYEKCRRSAGKNVAFLGHVEHARLPQYYKVAKIHALVSWMETPGLSSLEAGAMGCNLVITDKGDTRDYFCDLAFYCDPASIESIRGAIIRAYEAPVNPGLSQRIRKEFTWEKAAEKTFEGYMMALKTGGKPR